MKYLKMIKIKKIILDLLYLIPVWRLVFLTNNNLLSIKSLSIKVNLNFIEIADKIKFLILLGLCEKQEIKFIKSYLPSNLPVIELGSSIGVVSNVIQKKNFTK